MKPQPLAITLLEQLARRNARGMQTGRAEQDGVSCHYYPRSKSFAWWLYSSKCSKAIAIEHFRFQDAFILRREA